MYFGSVRFFKHLILAVVAIAIIVPLTFCIYFSVQNAQKTEQLSTMETEKAALEKLVKYYNGEKELTVDDIYAIVSDLGLEENLVELLFNKNPFAFDNVAEELKSGVLIDRLEDDDVEAVIAQTDDGSDTIAEDTQEETPSTYLDLHTELYYAGDGIYQYADDEDTIYLTFDDGPSEYTEDILYYLDKYEIKATFFVVPDGTEENAALIKKIADAGHTIGIHSASHAYEDVYSSVEVYLDDFQKAYDLVYEATGIKCRFYRFPGGSVNDYNINTCEAIIQEMNRRGFLYFDWNVDSADGIGETWTTIYNSVLNGVAEQERSVVLLHDGIYNTTLVLEDIINALKSDPRNFTFSGITDQTRPLQF